MTLEDVEKTMLGIEKEFPLIGACMRVSIAAIYSGKKTEEELRSILEVFAVKCMTTAIEALAKQS